MKGKKVAGPKQFLNPTRQTPLATKAWPPALFWAHGSALKVILP